MKHRSSSQEQRRSRRNAGQMVAVLVMALTLAVGGAGTTLLLASQPTGLTVEPAIQSTSDRSSLTYTEKTPEKDRVQRPAAQSEEPVSSAAEQTQPEAVAVPQQPDEPETPQQEIPAEEPAASQQPDPVWPELPAAGDLEEENGLHYQLFQPETEALAAEDPMRPPQELAVPDNGLTDGASWPYEEAAVTLTPEQIEAALNAGTMTAAESRCISLNAENCLRWLWEWLFGKPEEPEYSGWHTEKDKTYYYDPATNQAVTGIQSIDGKLYYFDADGVMQDATFGIDVSKYQSGLDWDKIKQAGVEFVIVRIGYRGYGSGTLVLDPMFEEHFTNARNAGLRVGVYMFSQAINEDEAREEAFACAYVLNGRALDYPIYFDTEASGSPNGTGRADGLGVQDRTACAVAFCEEVKLHGYQPGVYASTIWFKKRLDLNALRGYSIWNAHYGVPIYGIECDLWQGSCTARIDGYSGPLDVNISYIG
ncbi:MAG: GH25 family lysozyme [Faecalibacterium sp.]